MRIFGYLLGMYLLANGLLTAALPRWWTDLSIDTAERVLPPRSATVVEDFRRLPPRALRYAGFVETILGVAVLALASRIGVRSFLHTT